MYPSALRSDGLAVEELPTFDLQDHGRLVGVAILVDRDFAGHSLKILGLIDRIAEFWTFCGVGSANGFEQDVRRIETQGSKAVRGLVESRLVLRNELLDHGVGIIRGIVIREEGSVQGISANRLKRW